jgi:hypothetical protein
MTRPGKRRERTVKAKKVRAGDFLVGLDDGYVYETTDPYPGDEGANVEIVFHDDGGGENTLVCWRELRITVSREVKS